MVTNYNLSNLGAPAASATAITVSQAAATPGRAIFVSCTSAGSTTMGFPDGTTIIVPLQANTDYQYNWSITTIPSSTATATYYLLY